MTIWVRLGISVAVASLFCIVITEFLQSTGCYDAYRWHICAVLLGAGPVVFLLGRNINARAQGSTTTERISLTSESELPAATEREPFLLFNLAYWGVMLVVFGVILLFIVPHPEQAAAAREAEAVRPAAVQAPTNTPPLPDLRMQGLVYRPLKSSVIFNGHTYAVGEQVQGAKVVAISVRSVTLEWHGQTHVLDLEKELLRSHY